MERVKIEFIGLMPTLYAHCQHCMQVMHGTGLQPYSEQLEEYPEEIKKVYFKVSELAQKIRNEFGERIAFDAIDTASPKGIWLTLKYRIKKTPCVIINGRKAFDYVPSYEELRNKILTLLGTEFQLAK